jgi:hypothetical protein
VISSWRADRKIRKLLRDAKAKPLAEVRENVFVRVTGVVQPHRARVLEAPLSGRLCAYYSIVIRAPVSMPSYRVGRRHTYYATLAEEQEGVPFELAAGGARAVIDPTDAWISSGFDHNSHLDSSERALDMWRRRGLVGSSPHASFHEAVLAVGERVAVFGAAMREPDPDAIVGEQGYRDGGPMRLRFSGSAKFPLVIRDDLGSL